MRPPVVTMRKLRYTYAYVGAENYKEGVHNPRRVFTTPEGLRLVSVVYPLVSQGVEVGVGTVAMKEGLLPVRDMQTTVEFELYRTTSLVVNPKDKPEPRGRTIVLSDPSNVSAEYGESYILPTDRVATLSIDVGRYDPSLPRSARSVDLALVFSSTEVLAYVKPSSAPADDLGRPVAIRYD